MKQLHDHTLRITPVAMPPSMEENTRLSIKKEASLMSESRLKKSVFDTLTTRILKTIKMVMVIGVLSLTPDLSQGLRKGIHRIETVLTVLLCGQNQTHSKTTTPASLRHPLLMKEGSLLCGGWGLPRLMLGAAVETLYTPSRFIGINSHLPDRPMSGWLIEGNLMERS